MKQTDPHLPWTNAAESTIRELKSGTSRKMLNTRSPKQQWDPCLELESKIQSCTKILSLNVRETLEMITKGSQVDISEICEFE